MATADEILATMAEEAAETGQAAEVCTIDDYTRAVAIPERLRIIGVEHDDDVVIRHFKVPSKCCETDLTTFAIRVNYQNANGEKDCYYVPSFDVNGDYIEFGWLIERAALRYKGTVTFVVNMELADATGTVVKEWNSARGAFTVLEGLEVVATEEEEETARNVVTQLIQLLDEAAEEKTAQTLASIPDEYIILDSTVKNLTSEVAAVKETADAAIKEPATTGSAGQVLGLNADGSTEWMDSGMEAGTENAGKIMMVAPDGKIVPGELLLQSVENTYGSEGRVAGILEYGIVRESSEWDTTAYIPIPEATGNELTLTFYAATAQWYPFGFYAAEDEASLIPSNPPNVYVKAPGEVQLDVPSGARYFRVSYLVEDIDAIWVRVRLTSQYAQRMDELEENVGTDKLDKSAGADKAGQILMVDSSGDIVPAALQTESIVATTDATDSVEGMLEYGSLSASKTEWRTTPFLPVPTAEDVSLVFYAATAQYYPFMFYYSANQGDQVSGAGPNMYAKAGEHEIEIPAGANYFRISFLAADEAAFWVRFTAESAISKRFSELDADKLDKAVGEDKAGQYLVVDGSGSIVPAPLLVESEVTTADVSNSAEGMLEYGHLSASKTEWKTTAFIPVPTADVVKLTFYAATAQYYPFMFYYSENQGDQVSGAGPNMYCTAGEHEIAVPAGANYFRMSYLAADEGAFWLQFAADSALSKRISDLESRAMGSLMKLQGKRLSIIGDSISTFKGWIPDGYAAYYPYMASMAVVENCWWHRLLTETGMVLGRNCSWSGSMVTGDTDSTTSASCAASDKRIADLVDADGNAPDVIICYIGINDFTSGKDFGDTTGAGHIAATGTISDISTAYALMLTKLQAAYPDANIYCCTLTPTLQHYDGTVYSGTFPVAMAGGTLPELNAIIRTIAINLGCGVIDLARCGLNHHNISSNSVDSRLHPDDKGHAMIADKALQGLLNN